MMKATWASIALTLAGTASMPLFAGDLWTEDGSTELVSKVYDLGHLRMRKTEFGRKGKVLFPPSQSLLQEGKVEWHVLTESFIGLVESVLWEGIEYDGRSMDSSGDEHLYLKAPASTHAELRELLGFYEGLCTAGTQMRLFWVQVPEGTETPSGLVSGDEATDWIDGLPDEAYSSDILDVPAYRAGGARQVHSTPVLSEADIEIAQGAATLDSVVRTVRSGRRTMIHAIPGVGGLQLSMTWSDVSRPVLTDKQLQIVALLGAEGKPAAPVNQGGTIQLIRQSANMSSTRVFIPDGMASISKVSSKGGVSTLLVAVPHAAAPLEQSYQLSGPRKDRGVAFLMRSLAPLQTRWELEGAFGYPRHWSDRWCLHKQTDSGQWVAERALEDVARDLVEYTHVGGYIVLHTARGVSRDQLQIAHMELDRAAKRMRSMMPKSTSYKVTLSGYADGNEKVLEVEQVVALGSQSTWFCGAERTYIEGFDVEVAQYAAMHDPDVATCMEGSLIELALVPNSEGDLQVQINARMNLPQGFVDVDDSSPMHASTKRMTYQRIHIDTLRKLTQKDSKGAWTANFGGHGEGSLLLHLKVESVE